MVGLISACRRTRPTGQHHLFIEHTYDKDLSPLYLSAFCIPPLAFLRATRSAAACAQPADLVRSAEFDQLPSEVQIPHETTESERRLENWGGSYQHALSLLKPI